MKKMIGRSALFVPANSPSMINNCVAFDADSIIFDLEDAVLTDEKDSARILLREALKSLDFLHDKNIMVRINALSTQYWECDVEELIQVRPQAFVIPKATPAHIETIDRKITELEKQYGVQPTISLIPLIETALAVETVNEILKSSRRIIGLLFGAEDFTTDMGIKRTKDGEEIFYARAKLATVAHALGIEAIDTPFTDIEDTDNLIKDATIAKTLGMTGKAAIHPKQIKYIHEVFTPTQEEVNYAIKVLSADKKAREKGMGAFSLDGKMVDPPIILRAKHILKRAGIEGKW